MITPKDKLRWFQFGRRTPLALLLILLVCIVMGWVGLLARQWAKEREERAKIRKMWQENDAKWGFGFKLMRGLGGGLCPNTPWELGAAYVEFHGTFSDTGVEQLKAIPEIGMLDLNNTMVTDKGLAHLKSMTQLKMLHLNNTKVTDAGLEYLKRLVALDDLDLGQTRVTNAGLKHLTGLKQLKELGLEGTQVTNEGVKKLQQALPNCQIDR